MVQGPDYTRRIGHLDSKGFDLKGFTNFTFTDVEGQYEEAVKALVADEITKGISKTQFGVHQHAKRGDYAIFLHKAYLATR